MIQYAGETIANVEPWGDLRDDTALKTPPTLGTLDVESLNTQNGGEEDV